MCGKEIGLYAWQCGEQWDFLVCKGEECTEAIRYRQVASLLTLSLLAIKHHHDSHVQKVNPESSISSKPSVLL